MKKILMLFVMMINLLFSETGGTLVKKQFLIAKSTKSYKEAKQFSENISRKTGIALDLRGLNYNKETMLSASKEYPHYVARGYNDDGIYISIEHTNYYENFTNGYYIVVVASGVNVKKTLKEIKGVVKDAYIKTSNVNINHSKTVDVENISVTDDVSNHDKVDSTLDHPIQQKSTSRNNISNIETVKAEDLVAFPNDYAYKNINVECRIPNDATITYRDELRSYDINLNCGNGDPLDFSSSMNLAMNLDTVTSKDIAKFIRNNEGKKCIVTGQFKPKNISGSNLQFGTTRFTHTLFINNVEIF